MSVILIECNNFTQYTAKNVTFLYIQLNRYNMYKSRQNGCL